MAVKKRIMRQAVVLIHGIGDQKPMATLRDFVGSVLGELTGKPPDKLATKTLDKQLYYSLPDTLDETFELRRLMTMEPRRTDFYELYWAHLMPTASTNRINSWFWTLMVRKFSDVPDRVRLIWLVSWLVLLAIVALGAWSIVGYLAGGKPVTIPAGSAPPAALLGLLGLVWLTARSYIGDAAVYLSPSPENIDARRKIRVAALTLLQKLNQDPRYDRIVVVGHSLGSVIGYDAIGLCWQAYLKQSIDIFYRNTAEGQTTKNSIGQILKAEKILKEVASGRILTADEWHGIARTIARDTASNGNPWKITDFITLGSPLTYGDFLLSRGCSEFALRQQQRELPVSPPVLEAKGFTYYQRGQSPDGKWLGIRVPHHAAAFCATAWTNLHFGSRAIFWGDLIGGPLAPQFGAGIKDIKVKTSIWFGFLSHTRYWAKSSTAHTDNALIRLCEVLNLGPSDTE